MPNIGETCKASDLNYQGRATYIYYICPDCKTPRWKILSNKYGLCGKCAATRRARELTPVTYGGVGEPKIGDTTTSQSLGYSDRGIRYYTACPKCGKARWVRKTDIETVCIKCAHKAIGEEHHNYSGGRKVKRGYVSVKIEKDDPMYPMSRNGWVLEHRLVIARNIGRILKNDEVVHHINGIKTDNRLENLQLMKNSKHNSHMVNNDLKEKVRALENKVLLLEVEVVRLKKEMSGVRDSDNNNNVNINRYNTPGGYDIPEGIVRAFSNEGNDIESV
jgi:hypothetical protein